MKIRHILILITTIIISWLLPDITHTIIDKPAKNFFVYYSSVEKSFCRTKFNEDDKSVKRINIATGKEYSRTEFDSILPLFYYRQLLSEDKMPKEIHGTPICPKSLSKKTFFFSYRPVYKNSPNIPLYTLFESASGRVRLQTPPDMFRINNSIEFINSETNTVNKEKSKLFNNELEKQHFAFPPKIVAGNPSARKDYDEGCFILDNNNKLFQLKMQKGKPFVKKIYTADSLQIAHISTCEPKDRSFLAFLFDKQGYIYVLYSNSYKIQNLPIAPQDINNTDIRVMTNPLYWIIETNNSTKKVVYAVKSANKELVDKINFSADTQKNNWLKYIFTYELTFKIKNSNYIKPSIAKYSPYSVIANMLLALIFFIILPSTKRKSYAFDCSIIIVTGIFGFIAELIFLLAKNE